MGLFCIFSQSASVGPGLLAPVEIKVGQGKHLAAKAGPGQGRSLAEWLAASGPACCPDAWPSNLPLPFPALPPPQGFLYTWSSLCWGVWSPGVLGSVPWGFLYKWLSELTAQSGRGQVGKLASVSLASLCPMESSGEWPRVVGFCTRVSQGLRPAPWWQWRKQGAS